MTQTKSEDEDRSRPEQMEEDVRENEGGVGGDVSKTNSENKNNAEHACSCYNFASLTFNTNKQNVYVKGLRTQGPKKPVRLYLNHHSSHA